MHSLIIYFGSILVPENNGKQSPNESYTKEYQKHVACSYCYKLVCVDDKYIRPFNTHLGEDSVYNFISSISKKENSVVM